MNMLKKKGFFLRDAKNWVATNERGEDIPMFIFNHDIKASTMPEGFFRYYGRIGDGALWGVHSRKNIFDRDKNVVCIVTMEPLKYSWKQNRFMLNDVVSRSSKKDIKKCIKKRYGKAALNVYRMEVEFD